MSRRASNLTIRNDIGVVRLENIEGDIQCTTNVGAIEAENVAGQVTLTANTGDINVSVPANASATVEAQTQIGAIRSDLPLDISGPMHPGDTRVTAAGVLGNGQGSFDLTTNVGGIVIRAARGPSRGDRERGLDIRAEMESQRALIEGQDVSRIASGRTSTVPAQTREVAAESRGRTPIRPPRTHVLRGRPYRQAYPTPSKLLT